MKLQGVIILRIEDFREFFHFPDFWNSRFAFAKYWKDNNHRIAFSDDRKVWQMLDIIISWIEGKDLNSYKVEDKCLRTSSDTNFVLWNYDHRITKLPEHNMQIGVAALMIIIEDNPKAIDSIFTYLFAEEGISDVDWSKPVNIVHAGECHTIEQYKKEDKGNLRNVLIVNCSEDGEPAIIEIKGLESVSIEPGGFSRLLMIGNKAVGFLTNQEEFKVDTSSHTSMTPDGQPAISFVSCLNGGYAYVTDYGKVKCTLQEINLRAVSFLKGEQAVHVGVKCNGREGFVLTSYRRLFIFNTKSLTQGPIMQTDVVFAQYDRTDTLKIKTLNY